jgi:hypothetical protein
VGVGVWGAADDEQPVRRARVARMTTTAIAMVAVFFFIWISYSCNT